VDRESEAAVAAVLAGVLADDEYWRQYAAATGADAPSSLLAQRAVDLWRGVVAFLEEALEESWDVDLDAPVVQALAAVREIADWGVLASYARAQVSERIPPRSAFDWLIRVGASIPGLATLATTYRLSKARSFLTKRGREANLSNPKLRRAIWLRCGVRSRSAMAGFSISWRRRVMPGGECGTGPK
jgi:hypothetical protein